MNEAEFWSNQDAAQKTINEFKLLKAQTDDLEKVMIDLDEAKIGIELAREAGDQELLEEADESLFGLERRMEKVELQSLLSGPHEHRNCFVYIQSGDGGTEADDWASMLDRMYSDWPDMFDENGQCKLSVGIQHESR